MFFDVTRAGTDRPLRIAVAAIAYLDTLPVGCVLHLLGGQGLQVTEDATEVEVRALAAAAPVADLQPVLPCPTGSMMAAELREMDETSRALLQRGAIDPAKELAAAELTESTGVSPVGTALAVVIEHATGVAAPADEPPPSNPVVPPAPTNVPAPKARHRRGQPR